MIDRPRDPTPTTRNDEHAGIINASIGRIGGARAQYELRQSMVFLNMFPINHPEGS